MVQLVLFVLFAFARACLSLPPQTARSLKCPRLAIQASLPYRQVKNYTALRSTGTGRLFFFSMPCKTAGHLLLCTNEEGSCTSVLCFLPADRCFGLGRCGRQKSRSSGVCVRAVRGGTNESFARCLAASWCTTTTTASACAACFVCKRTRPKTRRSFARSLLAKKIKVPIAFLGKSRKCNWQRQSTAPPLPSLSLFLFPISVLSRFFCCCSSLPSLSLS